jgi:hypothetical protein
MLCYRGAITDRIEPAHFFYRTIWVAGKVARVLSHYRRIFPLGNLVLAEPKIAGERDRIFDAYESARLDEDHVGQWHHFRFWRRRRISNLFWLARDLAVATQLK